MTAQTDLDAIRIRLLGTIDLVQDAGGLGGPRRRLLLAALALRPGTLTTVGELAEALWPQDPPDEPQRSLQVHVSKLRAALRTSGVDATIAHRGDGYVLEAARDVTDVAVFEDLVGEGVACAQGEPSRARHALRRALALWRGAPLGGLADDCPLRSEVTRLEALRLRALEVCLGAELATGHHEDVTGELQQLTDRHPLQEQLWAHLLLALYRSGRQAEALAAYARARAVFADELGADPSRELQELHARILQQDPSLDLVATSAATPGGGREDPDARTVAVLPFDVLGQSEDAALLASGLHTDLLTQLSRVERLTVISRSSVLGYRSSSRPAPQIARELGVGTIVTGSVQSAGRRIRLTVQLVDGPRGVHRWAASYDDELTPDNLFAIQTELARDIAASLSAELDAARLAGADQPPTVDLDAYRLVAAGRQQLDLKTEDALHEAIACYQGAARVDPGYVQAWVGLADALVSMEAYGHGVRHELLPRAEQAVHRALALDPASAPARSSLGVLATAHQDGPAALAAFERATRLGPGYADAYNWLSWVCLLTGDAQRGLESARRAAELDPRAAEAHAHVALGLAAVGEPEAGLDAARVAGSLSPYATADLYEALCLYELGRFEQARDVLHPVVGSADEVPVPWTEGGAHALLALTLIELGDLDGAHRSAAGLEPGTHPFAVGLVQLGLGATDEAARAFARVERMTAWPCLLVHHYHRPLWSRSGAKPLRDRLVDVALRSWNSAGGPDGA